MSGKAKVSLANNCSPSLKIMNKIKKMFLLLDKILFIGQKFLTSDIGLVNDCFDLLINESVSLVTEHLLITLLSIIVKGT
jgi:hypothetical protein